MIANGTMSLISLSDSSLSSVNLLPENKAESLASPALAGRFFTTSATGKPFINTADS